MTYLKDRLYFALKRTLRNLDPFFRLTVKRVDKIVVINSSIAETMKAPKHKVVILPAVASEIPNIETEK